MTIAPFRAFRANTTGESIDRGVVTMTADELPADGVLIEVHWSSVNYKDGLASTPAGKVARVSPMVPGVDLAGVQPGPHLQADLPQAVTQVDGAPHRSTGSVEVGQEAVAGRVDLPAVVLLELGADHAVVMRQDLPPGGVAQPAGRLGRTHDVGHQDRRDDRAGRGRDPEPVAVAGHVEDHGRLVAHDQRRVVGQRARNRHALLLPAGKLAGVLARLLRDAHPL